MDLAELSANISENKTAADVANKAPVEIHAFGVPLKDVICLPCYALQCLVYLFDWKSQVR